MTPTPRFEARRTRTGRVVAVGAPMDLADALGERVEPVAPDGAQTATATLAGIGRIWTDDVTAFVRRNGLEAARRRAQKSLENLKHASLRTRQRVYDLVRELGTRSENRERIEETLALVTAAFGETE